MHKKIFLIFLLFGNLQASFLTDVNNLLFSEDVNFIHTSTNDSLTKSVISNGNIIRQSELITVNVDEPFREQYIICLLYTSDAADEERCRSRWSPYH